LFHRIEQMGEVHSSYGFLRRESVSSNRVLV
jgi:hypothetical protein